MRRVVMATIIATAPLLGGAPSALAAALYDFSYFLSQGHPFANTPTGMAQPVSPSSSSLRTAPVGTPNPTAGTTPSAAVPEMADMGSSASGGIYFSVNANGGYSTIHDPETTGITGLQERRDEDWVAGNTIAVGYDWAKHGWPVRTEIEVFIRYRFDLDYRGTAGGNLQGYTNEIGTYGGMVNGYYDLPFEWKKFSPYVGASIGMSRHWSQAYRKELSTAANTRVSQDTRTNQLTWAVMAGFIYQWKPNWGFRAEGRYWDLGEVENGPFGNNDTITAKYTSLDLMLGITYTP